VLDGFEGALPACYEHLWLTLGYRTRRHSEETLYEDIASKSAKYTTVRHTVQGDAVAAMKKSVTFVERKAHNLPPLITDPYLVYCKAPKPPITLFPIAPPSLSYLSMALGLAYYYLSQRWVSRVWLRERPSAMLVMTWIMMTR
jgi:hypothetical protein